MRFEIGDVIDFINEDSRAEFEDLYVSNADFRNYDKLVIKEIDSDGDYYVSKDYLKEGVALLNEDGEYMDFISNVHESEYFKVVGNINEEDAPVHHLTKEDVKEGVVIDFINDKARVDFLNSFEHNIDLIQGCPQLIISGDKPYMGKGLYLDKDPLGARYISESEFKYFKVVGNINETNKEEEVKMEKELTVDDLQIGDEILIADNESQREFLNAHVNNAHLIYRYSKLVITEIHDHGIKVDEDFRLPNYDGGDTINFISYDEIKFFKVKQEDKFDKIYNLLNGILHGKVSSEVIKNGVEETLEKLPTISQFLTKLGFNIDTKEDTKEDKAEMEVEEVKVRPSNITELDHVTVRGRRIGIGTRLHTQTYGKYEVTKIQQYNNQYNNPCEIVFTIKQETTHGDDIVELTVDITSMFEFVDDHTITFNLDGQKYTFVVL